jgi:hypothetical protein
MRLKTKAAGNHSMTSFLGHHSLFAQKASSSDVFQKVRLLTCTIVGPSHRFPNPLTMLASQKEPISRSRLTGRQRGRHGLQDEIQLASCQQELLNTSFQEPEEAISKGRQTRNKRDSGSATESTSYERILISGRYHIPLVITIAPGPDDQINEHFNVEEYITRKDLPALCLQLLESDDYDDIFRGIQRLVVLVNGELVNSKLENSVARVLVFGSDDTDETTSKIRALFPTFFRSSFDESRQDVLQFRDRDVHGVRSTDDASMYSDLTGSTARVFMSLHLPALRILVSALELCSRVQNQTINLSDEFWQSILRYMTRTIEDDNILGIATALVVKSLRLLRTIDPRAMEPYIKYSLLPSILNVKEKGKSSKDKMLVRECDRLLIRL